MNFNSAKNGLDLNSRPLGLWLLAACNVAGVVALAMHPVWVVSIFYNTEPQDVVLGPWAEFQAWTLLAIAVAIFLSTAGTVRGNKPARTLLLVLLAVVSLTAIWDSYCFAIWYRSSGYKLADMTGVGLWNASIGARFLGWFVVNFWYLRLSHARHFFTG